MCQCDFCDGPQLHAPGRKGCEMAVCEITGIKECNKIVPMVNLTQEAWHDSTVPCLENLSQKLPGDVAMQENINSDYVNFPA